MHGKPYFLFPDVLKRWSYQKIALEYGLSWTIGKDDITFSRKYDLTPWAENERWSFSKKYMGIWYFLRMFWKDGLFKKIAPEHDLSCIFWKDSIFFLKMWYFFFGQKMKDDLSQEIHGNMIFSLCRVPLPKKSYPAKIHLAVIDTLDWHYFHGDHCACFPILLSSDKHQET